MSYRLECDHCMESVAVDREGNVPLGWGYMQTEVTERTDSHDDPVGGISILGHTFMYLCPKCITTMKTTNVGLFEHLFEGDRNTIRKCEVDSYSPKGDSQDDAKKKQ